jgi:Ribonuclease G/E
MDPTRCPYCYGTRVRRDRLPGTTDEWLERTCPICMGRGWLRPDEPAALREQGILDDPDRR